ncbi:MAG: hypothetical protein ACRDGN_10425 [bacterium]
MSQKRKSSDAAPRGYRRGALSLSFAMSVAILGAGAAASPVSTSTSGKGPPPGSSDYVARDVQNMLAAHGRQTAPDGQLNDPEYQIELAQELAAGGVAEEAPFRYGKWNGVRGQFQSVSFKDRGGSDFSGRIYAPRAGATNPDTGTALNAPFPGVVVESGDGSLHQFYAWAAEDLAERGYVVLAFTVAGSQNAMHYFTGLQDAINFFWSTPSAPYAGGGIDAFNPYWKLFDRSPDQSPVTTGRPYRFAVLGHSLGAFVASVVGNMDARVSAIVAWDKLIKNNSYFTIGFDPGNWKPTIPALAVQSEYFATATPYTIGCFLVFGCEAYDPTTGPPPARELSTGYGGRDGWGIVHGDKTGGWVASGVDVMVLVPRSSTHEEYLDQPYAPASRYGQALTSYYQTAWLDKYLKHDPTADARLAATAFRQLEPKGRGVWGYTPLLQRDDLLSFYFCSAWRYHAADGSLVQTNDAIGVGCS